MAGPFSLDLARFCKKYDANMHAVIRKIAFETFKRVVLRTPVDTGRARANWGVRVGQPTTFTTEGVDKGGGKTLQAAMEGVNAWSADGSIFLTNNLSYILGLEYSDPGSKQAPAGMVRVTIAEMKAWIEANAGKESIGDIRGKTGGY